MAASNAAYSYKSFPNLFYLSGHQPEKYMSKMTTATINKEFKRLELDVRVYREKSGYFYFIGGTDYIPSIHVCRTTEYTLQEWVDYVLKYVRES
jgi:hypothetical protein